MKGGHEMVTDIGCENCKYINVDVWEEPCRECKHIKTSRWEPDEAEKRSEDRDAERTKGERPKMMPESVSYYDRDSSRLPDRIRASFEDGSSAVYIRRVEQPAPVILENIRIIRKWRQGYVNQPEIRRRGRR